MSTTAAELDMGPVQARVVSSPLGRELTQATPRLAIKRFLLLGLVLGDAYVGGEVTVIAPKVSGLIAEVAVTENQWVHAGDLLVKLDARD